MHDDKISSEIKSCPMGLVVPLDAVFSSTERQSRVRLTGAHIDSQLVVYEVRPTKLTDRDIIALSRDLLHVYESGFLLPKATERQECLQRIEDLYDHIKGSNHILVAQKDGNAVAFVCGALLETPLGKVYHLTGIVCESSVQGTGVGELLLRLGVSRSDATLMCMHTQSLKMLKLFSRIAEPSEEVALMLAASVSSSKLDGVIDRGRYHGRCLYGDFDTFQAYAIPSLDARNGDALFVAGLLKDGKHGG